MKNSDGSPSMDMMRARMLAEMPDEVADHLLDGELQERFLAGSLENGEMPPPVRAWVEGWEAEWIETR